MNKKLPSVLLIYGATNMKNHGKRTRFINNIFHQHMRAFALSILIASILPVFVTIKANALSVSNELAALTEDEYIIYSQNDIFFAAPDCISTGGPSSVCGDTAKEMYWSALSQYIDDPVKVAGVMGNLAAEGLFQPVLWEFAYTNDDGTLQASWDRLYNCGNDTCPFGVGAFGFTYHLGKYLHAVNDENPDLLKYFQNSVEYSLADADELMKKIGKDDFARLVEFEVKYAIETWEPETTQRYLNQKFANPSDAAYWWMDQWERPGIRTESARRSAAEKVYDEFKDFKCTPSSSTSAATKAAAIGAKSDITLIGDSIAVQAEAELQNKFPGSFMSKVGSRHSTSKGSCSIDEGGLDILKKIVSKSGTVADQRAGSEECVQLTVTPDSLKENVVWELGTNSTGANEATIKNVMALIGQQHKLFLVTPYNGDNMSGADSIAEVYRKIAKDNDNVYVVDWNNAVRDNAKKYITTDDGMAVHPTADGRQLLADLIEEAINGSSDCVSANYKSPEYIKRLDKMDTFIQWRGTWKDHLMCSGSASDQDIHHNGCGMMSLMGLYYLFSGKGLDDEKVFKELIHGAAASDGYNGCNGSAPLLWGENIEKYTKMSLETLWVGEQYTDDKWDSLVNALKQGKKVLIGTTGEVVGGKSKFAYQWHQLFLDHYNAQKDAVLLFDPSMSEDRAAFATSVGPTGDIYDGVYINREAMEKYLAPDEAFSVTYDGQTCFTACEDSGGSINGGLTEEQAQKLVDYYNSDKVSADYWGLPSGKTNCVSLSMWFVQAFTKIGRNGNISDNGNGVAHQTAVVGNLEQGNDPRPFSVFSVTAGNVMCGDSPCGHTGIVVGVNGDDVLTIEAGYPSTPGYVEHRKKDYFVNTRFGKSITYLETIFNQSDLTSAIGR